MSPTSRSLKKLRDEGWPLVEIVEHWNSFTHQRKDLFGFADILAIRGDVALLVQTTSGSNASARIEKIRASESARVWLSSPNRKIVVHGWAKRGDRGKRKVWTCREVNIGLEAIGMLGV